MADLNQKARDQWGSKVGFILAAIGSAIGLGNIWRFSYMAYANGGGAFLIPYFFALLTAGIPLLILEFGFGHKMRGSAPLSFARFDKKWEWLGWFSSIISFAIVVYYVVIVAWGVSYFAYSFNLGWGENPETFFYNSYLGITDISEGFVFGGFSLNVLIPIIIVWVLNYVIVMSGVKSGIEKASKIFMPILAIICVIIVIRGITLEGSIEGIKHYLTPNFAALKDYKVWMAAYGQIFFTLSLGMAIMITYSSYLPKKTDIVNSAFITSFANCGFSFLLGLGVFGILGYMAGQLGVPIDEVAKSGIGLAFIVFPKAISLMPMAEFVGIVFFLCLILAGLSSSISLVEAFTSSLIDKFEMPRRKAVTIVSGLGLLISMIFATGSGLYILDIVDNFLNNFGLVAVGMLEAIVLGYMMKAQVIKDHVNSISDFRVGKWWDVSIKFITPLILLYMFVQKIRDEIIAPYGAPDYSRGLVAVLGYAVIIAIIVLSFVFSNVKWRDEATYVSQGNAREVK
ncbi:MAG: sodium-dependent transporter [Clostridia bacterium]|nr:sodium-dependent transporter [Clostridia bacterium]